MPSLVFLFPSSAFSSPFLPPKDFLGEMLSDYAPFSRWLPFSNLGILVAPIVIPFNFVVHFGVCKDRVDLVKVATVGKLSKYRNYTAEKTLESAD